MNTVEKDALAIVGIETRTSNHAGKAEVQIPKLWQEFMQTQSLKELAHKKNETIYALYTDYESDHNGNYTMVLGHEVSNLDKIPEELSVKIVPKAQYKKFTAKGDLTKDAVINTWRKIWNTNLNRRYTTDIEIYDEKAMNPTNGEASIYVAVQ
ncbi:GyrI-like domain-containing protein [Flavicella sp.]|uniref:GyrI-like domain-containing protein n=1 Tax=Flavicella sp. TaxID=2957742 RepID=UPI002617ABB2|nr:GyrI-like domain-containing protein [Flavicella sp.]MDG1803633.1 GyrI-like domain-containing protein [Flavicella sp.]MDG2280502.1 GyrI-like domain-containing protein [Flavicella sp.]